MGKLHEFTLKHNRFTQDIDSYVEGIIDDNQELLNLNKSQLRREHKDIYDQDIGPAYTPEYADYKGFEIPNLYDSGDMFMEMTIEAKGKEYEIKSGVSYFQKLFDKYDDSFGIAISKQPKAKRITTEELGKQYKKIVYGN